MKKFLVIFLVCSMVLAGLSLPAAAAGFKDTEGLSCEEAVSLLNDIGIVDGKTKDEFAPEDTLSRAEMVTMLLRTMNMSSALSDVQVFEDVPQEHWAFGMIGTAYTLKMINGVSETQFAPDAPVLTREAIKMTVNTLGYTVKAEAAGGYPTGYMILANQLELLKGIKAAAGDAITRGEMSILLENALDVSLFELATFGSDNGAYAEGEKTLLTAHLGIQKYEGRVSATPVSIVSPSVNVEENEFAIDTVKFAGANGEAFVGRQVTVYAKEAEGSEVLTALHVRQKASTEVITVECEDVSPGTSTTTLIYDNEDGEEERLTIASDAVLVYNGKNKFGWTADILKSGGGTLTCICDTEGTANVLLLNRYKNYIVESVSEKEGVIYPQKGDKIAVSDGTVDAVQLLNTSGKAFKLADCAKGDVISVAYSEGDGKKILRLYRSNEIVTGTITEITTNTEIVVADKVLELADDYLGDKPEAGKAYALRLDYRGEIASAELKSEKTQYGYLMMVAFTKGVDAAPQVKLFTSQGKMQVFSMAERIQFNGISEKREIVGGSPLLTDGTNAVRQLLAYETNEKGEITAINTAQDGTGMDWETRTTVFSMDFYLPTGNDGARYIGFDSRLFATRYRMTDDTIVFFVPEDPNAAESEYVVGDISSFAHGETYPELYFYDVDAENNITVCMQIALPRTDTSMGSVGVVDGTVELLDEEGIAVTGLRVFYSGRYTVLTFKDDIKIECDTKVLRSEKDPKYGAKTLSLHELEKGDVVQFSQDIAGKVDAMSVRFRANYPIVLEKGINNTKDVAPQKDYNFYHFQYLYGTVDRTVTDGVILNTNVSIKNNIESIERLYPLSAEKSYVVLYDKSRGTMEAVNIREPRKDDVVFASRKTAGVADLVVIYRN